MILIVTMQTNLLGVPKRMWRNKECELRVQIDSRCFSVREMLAVSAYAVNKY